MPLRVRRCGLKLYDAFLVKEMLEVYCGHAYSGQRGVIVAM